MAQSIKDAKNAVHKLARGVMKHPGAQQSTALIRTCAEMCQAEGVSFGEVLQDLVFEGHGTLYSFLDKLQRSDHYGLLSAILNNSGPLSSKAVDDIDGCAPRYGQAVFSHFWRHPAYHGLSGTDKLSLGGTSPADYVGVSISFVPNDVDQTLVSNGFFVRFDIIQFHKRMSTSGGIVLKFMANSLSSC